MRSQLDSGSYKSFWSKSWGHLEQWWILIYDTKCKMRANGLSKLCFRMIFILCLLSVANGLGFRRKIDWIFRGDIISDKYWWFTYKDHCIIASIMDFVPRFTPIIFISLTNVVFFTFSTIMKWRYLDLLQSLLRKYNVFGSFDKYSIGTVNRHGAKQFITL